jgi:hypothetical protein
VVVMVSWRVRGRVVKERDFWDWVRVERIRVWVLEGFEVEIWVRV